MTEPIICKNGIAICHLIGKTLSICGSINNAYYYELPTKSVSIKNQLDNIRIIKKQSGNTITDNTTKKKKTPAEKAACKEATKQKKNEKRRRSPKEKEIHEDANKQKRTETEKMRKTGSKEKIRKTGSKEKDRQKELQANRERVRKRKA